VGSEKENLARPSQTHRPHIRLVQGQKNPYKKELGDDETPSEYPQNQEKWGKKHYLFEDEHMVPMLAMTGNFAIKRKSPQKKGRDDVQSSQKGQNSSERVGRRTTARKIKPSGYEDDRASRRLLAETLKQREHRVWKLSRGLNATSSRGEWH